ncbi:hypothetical protein EDD37DRAFT_654041 [Exophiala viscosa]|uniref:uncharacterized protein n=1 Tax=Exophiala viscosa TaxID=2486360 RepID=UPI00219DDDD9|nr:hypothetical protein EDD37DRAFT_654041 [Exophiala viscosa]
MTAYTREVNRAARAARAAPAPVAAGSPSTPISTRLLPAPPNAPLMRSLAASVRDTATPPISPPTVTNNAVTTATTSLASLESRVGRIEAATFSSFGNDKPTISSESSDSE